MHNVGTRVNAVLVLRQKSIWTERHKNFSTGNKLYSDESDW